jgi:beta-1,4-mannosyltransferase
MNILFIPNYSKTNPYQLLLKKALEKTGAHITLARSLSLKDFSSQRKELDVLHIHWTQQFFDASGFSRFYFSFFASLARLLIFRMRGIPIVWTVHNLVSHDSRHRRSEYLFSVFLIAIARRLIVHSEMCKKQFLEEYHGMGREKVTVVPHGNYIGVYDDSISREDARQQLGLSSQDKVFLSLGNVRPYKGLQACIRSFTTLENPFARLLVVGKPITEHFADELRRHCASDPRLRCVLTFVDDHDLQLYLNAADVMIFPFQNIFTSGSLILGMSFSKAIIAPKKGAIPDYVDASGALLYDPEVPDGLPNAMRAALERFSELPLMGHANFEKARQLDWDAIGLKTAAIYDEIRSRPDK